MKIWIHPIVSSAKAASPDDISYYDKSKGLTFFETSRFRASAETLNLSDESLFTLQSEIIKDPTIGDRVQGVPGARKVRVAYIQKGNSNKKLGQRSGLRVIYVVFFVKSAVFLLDIYYKNKKEDLSSEDKKRLNSMLFEIRKGDV